MTVYSLFQEKLLPEKDVHLSGYAALVAHYELKVPSPERYCFISHRHQAYETQDWVAYPARYRPADTFEGQLTFALRYEPLDLGVLKALFQRINQEVLICWIRSEPTGRYSRRAWFLYEWLMDALLDVPDASTGNFVEVLDSSLQYAASNPISSRRHRVHNNLPGTRDFCPLIRRTKALEKFQLQNLHEKVKDKMGGLHPDLFARASAFMLLKDSRASFVIEGERPSKSRVERWGRALGQAGLYPLTETELLRLQSIVIEDHRFVKLGLRQQGGFIGVHDRSTMLPLPDHISARWEDLPILMEGLLSTYDFLKKQGGDSVLLATIIAFGFVFIHPFEDGNGRLHRYLIHHVLVELGFSPKGVVFPVSAVILERIDAYREILEAYSRPRLDYIEWKATADGNVEVLNDTIDLYRYFDATRQAEFLYGCVQQTIEVTLPDELQYLVQYDRLKTAIGNLFDMPDPMIDLLIRFLHQNKGVLSKRAREKEFAALTMEECEELETIYARLWEYTALR